MSNIKIFKDTLEQKILEANNIVIVPHNSVDFDAIGAATGIALIAKKYKKPYYIVVNDPVYGYKKLDDLEFGQMLHAKEIGFVHPMTKEFMDFTVEPPKRFMEILEKYKNSEE